jgi:hypothetical protein
MVLKFKEVITNRACILAACLTIGFIILWRVVIIKFLGTKDPLNKRLIKIGSNCCSFWPISHFIFYFILGLFFPQYQIEFIIIGIIWEIIEILLGQGCHIAKRGGGYRKLFCNENASAKGTQYTYWVSGSWSDIIFNIAGLYLGVLVNYLWKKRQKKLQKKLDEEKKKNK